MTSSTSSHQVPIARWLAIATAGLLLNSAALAHPFPTQVPAEAEAELFSRDYPELSNTRAQYASFNVEVMRGMAFDDMGQIFAINSYASSLLRYTVPEEPVPGGAPGTVSSVPTGDTWRTVTDPVAVAYSNSFVYVLGQGNHALAKHDPNDGEIVDLLMLPSEPADLVLDSTGDAWVSCMGADMVVRIDLGGPVMSVIECYALEPSQAPEGCPSVTQVQMKRPRFLFFDDVSDRILVAPFVSGNGSFAVTKPEPILNNFPGLPADPTQLADWVGNGFDVLDAGTIYDGETSAMSSLPGGVDVLPDNDLFAIDIMMPGAVSEVFFDVATLMTAHGRNPSTGAYWMLGTESDNVSETSEPDLAGKFATNELTVVKNTNFIGALSARFEAELDGKDIDNLATSGAPVHQKERSLSFPYALSFGEVGNYSMGAVASSTAPIVGLFSVNGNRLGLATGFWDIELVGAPVPPDGLPEFEGRVVRTTMFHEEMLYIYCQQTNNILVWQFDETVNTYPVPYDLPTFELSLGSDPTPVHIARGRELWYDGINSENGRISCNTCHPGGESDLLAWPLTAKLTDHKGIMVTQTLKGALDAFPFHWRGERDLIDFNGAFPGLLKGEELPTDDPSKMELPYDRADFGAFQDFLFSLQPAANPLQSPSRRVEADLTPHAQYVVPNTTTKLFGNPIRGLEVYMNETVINANCANCHIFPSGSLGVSVSPDNFTHFSDDWRDGVGLDQKVEIAALHNFMNPRRQGQPLVWETASGGPGAAKYEIPFLGFGMFNSGVHPTLNDFLFRTFFRDVQPQARRQVASDVAAMVDLFDSGTAPAVHQAFLMTSANVNTVKLDVLNMIRQTQIGGNGLHAGDRWVDVVALRGSGTGTYESYVYDPAQTAFVDDSSAAVTKSYVSFINEAANGVNTVFFGCLPGHGERLGVDFDDDGLRNRSEALAGLDAWDSDDDDDGFPDGYEVDVATASPGVVVDPLVKNDWDDIKAEDATAPTFDGVTPNGPVKIFSSGRLLKYYFEASEPVRWSVVATDPLTAQSVTCKSDTYARRHVAVVRGLRPSGSNNGQASNFSVDYDLEWTLYDLADQPIAQSVPDTGRTIPHPAHVNLVLPGNEAGPAIQIIAEDASLRAAYLEAGTMQPHRMVGVYSIEIGDLHTPTVNLANSSGRWVPVVSVLRRANSTTEWEAVPLGEVLPVGGGSVNYVAHLEDETGASMLDLSSSPHFNVNLLVMPAIDPASALHKSAQVFYVEGPSNDPADYAVGIIGVYEESDPGTIPGSLPKLYRKSDAYRLSDTHRDFRLVTGK